MKIPTGIAITAALAISAAFMLPKENPFDTNNTKPLPLYSSRCDTTDLIALGYSLSIRDQIAYLCEQGFTKQKAIHDMKIALSNSSINPDQAYRVVLLGRALDNYDPLARR